jgi:hypothetical protein
MLSQVVVDGNGPGVPLAMLKKRSQTASIGRQPWPEPETLASRPHIAPAKNAHRQSRLDSSFEPPVILSPP